jgi:hypothetical protein
MMNIFQFMHDSPWLTFFIVYMLVELVFKIWNRFMRHLNIRSKGWPPEHLDADGDFESDEY